MLVLGLVIIGWAIFQSYNIFTAKAEAPLVFKTPSAQQPQGQLDQALQKQLSLILPPATITKVLNLIAWSMLALILIWGGSAISGIGTRMIRS